MISHKRLIAGGLTILIVCWAAAAAAEGSFFKDRRDMAAQAKPSAAPVLAPPAQAPAPAPTTTVARAVEQQDGAAAPEQEQAPAREERAPAPEDRAPAREEQSGAAQTQAPASAPAQITGQVSEVPLTDTLVVNGQHVKLAGVRGVSEMTQPLQRWIASTGNSVTCQPAGARYRCTTANGSDVGQVVLQNGGGTATPDAPSSYRAAEMQARMGHRGIWRQR